MGENTKFLVAIGAKELYDKLFGQLTDNVHANYSASEVNVILQWLLEYTLKVSQTEILLNKTIKVSDQQHQRLRQSIKRINREEPIQYILGECEFYGRKFKITPSVLIPRPETEELVQFIIQQHKNFEGLQVLDIGTGSGCIAITVAKELLNATVWALDSSQDALRVTQQNVKELAASVHLIEMDILSGIPDNKQLDILVSNPPYVLASEAKTMRSNVKQYEPAEALFVEDTNPLLFYRRISELCSQHLTTVKWVYLEVHENYATEIADLLIAESFSEVQVVQDMQNKDRFVVARR